jgi:ATP-dependent helicase/nuclease subunit B
MEVFFGLAFDDAPLAGHPANRGGYQALGPVGMLYYLESQLGLIGLPQNNDYLRIEQYRQALRLHLEQSPNAFYKDSFYADQFATAAELLARRDELILAGWDFQPINSPRLDCIADLENIIQGAAFSLAAGFADRFMLVLKYARRRHLQLRKVVIHEPEHLLPPHYKKLFDLFSKKGITISHLELPNPGGQSDLSIFQQVLSGTMNSKEAPPLKGDGSLLILRAKRESGLATYFAQLLRHNPDYTPSCLIPEKNNLLDHAITMEGLPSLGMLSASLARPTLQVLKLVTVFLWEPIDPFKIMEFVSLAVKPLEEELANRIANQMAQSPGLDSEGWHAMKARYFAELKERVQRDQSLDYIKIEGQYKRWFERKRYHISSGVPKGEVIEIFRYLAQWAFEFFEEEGSKNNSMLILSEQARRVKELLEELPEVQLSALELERVVRTIYEPAPIQLRDCQLGHLPYTLAPGAVATPQENLVWWNFVQSEPQHFFSRWYEKERQLLAQQNVCLEKPTDENTRLIWQRKRPILNCEQSLLLLVPHTIAGQEAVAHPLMGDLQATFDKIEKISLSIDQPNAINQVFTQTFQLPKPTLLSRRHLDTPKAFLNIKDTQSLGIREKETFSSLHDLFYYPYQWVFKHVIKLRKSSILSVVKDNTLMGNLAHRMFEKLLEQQNFHQWGQQEIEAFIEAEKTSLFKKEGAVMLMYGKEPERINFVRKLKFAARSLAKHINDNGWKVVGTEIDLEATFKNIQIHGRADLILQRGSEKAIIDLKWRGNRFREQLIRNEEDLQLVLYSKMIDNSHDWAQAAYFIMEKGLMIARNQQAFADITPIHPEANIIEVNQRIFHKMEATYQWRLQQLQQGVIEIRCKDTEQSLEEYYSEDNLFELLEMKSGDAPFDDYQTLINRLK